ncbi:MAG: protein translocase subunit SecF [Rhodobacterales bacterium CG_4_9_14_3_um_filter_71_31]|nr:MAG: protein translocase subunit SecF [Rhodobacterales bacterium CG_4_9_14_3_um_filter_71_31]
MAIISSSAATPPVAFSFVRLRRVGFAVSLALLLLTGAAVVSGGLALGLDFTGGVLVEAGRASGWAASDLRAALAAAGVADASVQIAGDGLTALVRAGGDAATLEAIRGALTAADGVIRAAEAVGPRVSAELLRDGALASVSAVAAIAVYVWLRFEARFGLAAFLTTLHDVALMVGFFALSGLTFDLTSVAAMLAVAGYSINDTVIVFDRIRETLARDRAAPLPGVIDRAITETLRRTLMTSGTTLMASVTLMALGGPVLFGFAAAVTVGVALGTLSSIFVAAPLLLHLPGALIAPLAEPRA